MADRPREGARLALAGLKSAGVRRTLMLTGDNRAAAQAVAAELGVDEARAELLPEDKVAAVRELASLHGGVAMVGDGVNDAPALAAATVGIAMGAAGTDAALETADVALMSDDLTRLPVAVRLSRRTAGIVRQNILFALLVKVVFIALTPLGYTSLWLAVAADMGASLLVIFNGLRALRRVRAQSRACGSGKLFPDFRAREKSSQPDRACGGGKAGNRPKSGRKQPKVRAADRSGAAVWHAACSYTLQNDSSQEVNDESQDHVDRAPGAGRGRRRGFRFRQEGRQELRAGVLRSRTGRLPGLRAGAGLAGPRGTAGPRRAAARGPGEQATSSV